MNSPIGKPFTPHTLSFASIVYENVDQVTTTRVNTYPSDKSPLHLRGSCIRSVRAADDSGAFRPALMLRFEFSFASHNESIDAAVRHQGLSLADSCLAGLVVCCRVWFNSLALTSIPRAIVWSAQIGCEDGGTRVISTSDVTDGPQAGERHYSAHGDGAGDQVNCHRGRLRFLFPVQIIEDYFSSVSIGSRISRASRFPAIQTAAGHARHCVALSPRLSILSSLFLAREIARNTVVGLSNFHDLSTPYRSTD